MAYMGGQLFVRDVEVPAQVRKLDVQVGPEAQFFGLPFDEAVALFSRRNVVSPEEFRANLDQMRSRSFTATRLATDQVRQRAFDALMEALQGDGDFGSFADAVRNEEASLGIEPSNHGYLRTVFNTNVVTAYSAGRDRQLTDPAVIEAIPYRLYVAVMDQRVRPEHAALDGTVWDARETDEWRRFQGPNGFNCFPGHVRVDGVVEAGLRGKYSGELVELTTHAGRVLTVTPNHPVATVNGFAAAGLVREGQELLAYVGGVEVDPVRAVDVEQSPSRIEDVWNAIAERGRGLRHRPVALDLHGDAEFLDGDVDVVWADRELLSDVEAERSQDAGDGVFVLPLSALSLEEPRRSLHTGGVAVDASSSSSPGSGALPLDGGAVVLESGPLHQFGLGPAAAIDARLSKPAGDDVAADAAFVRELLFRYPGEIAPDQVVKVRRFNASCHVYDLQSPNGWIVANDIVTSNCRCMVVSSEEAPGPVSMGVAHPEPDFAGVPNLEID